jgi:hypothetical protein
MALDWQKLCLNNQTLRTYTNYTSCNTTYCESGNISFYKDCEFGCDTSTNECKPSTFNQYLIVGIFLFTIFLGIAVLIKVTR